jgi:hypothetical protein
VKSSSRRTAPSLRVSLGFSRRVAGGGGREIFEVANEVEHPLEREGWTGKWRPMDVEEASRRWPDDVQQALDAAEGSRIGSAWLWWSRHSGGREAIHLVVFDSSMAHNRYTAAGGAVAVLRTFHARFTAKPSREDDDGGADDVRAQWRIVLEDAIGQLTTKTPPTDHESRENWLRQHYHAQALGGLVLARLRGTGARPVQLPAERGPHVAGFFGFVAPAPTTMGATQASGIAEWFLRGDRLWRRAPWRLEAPRWPPNDEPVALLADDVDVVGRMWRQRHAVGRAAHNPQPRDTWDQVIQLVGLVDQTLAHRAKGAAKVVVALRPTVDAAIAGPILWPLRDNEIHLDADAIGVNELRALRADESQGGRAAGRWGLRIEGLMATTPQSRGAPISIGSEQGVAPVRWSQLNTWLKLEEAGRDHAYKVEALQFALTLTQPDAVTRQAPTVGALLREELHLDLLQHRGPGGPPSYTALWRQAAAAWFAERLDATQHPSPQAALRALEHCIGVAERIFGPHADGYHQAGNEAWSGFASDLSKRLEMRARDLVHAGGLQMSLVVRLHRLSEAALVLRRPAPIDGGWWRAWGLSEGASGSASDSSRSPVGERRLLAATLRARARFGARQAIGELARLHDCVVGLGVEWLLDENACLASVVLTRAGANHERREPLTPQQLKQLTLDFEKLDDWMAPLADRPPIRRRWLEVIGVEVLTSKDHLFWLNSGPLDIMNSAILERPMPRSRGVPASTVARPSVGGDPLADRTRQAPSLGQDAEVAKLG